LEVAAKIFLLESADDHISAANLAYMARRGETGATQGIPPLDKLLEKGLSSKTSIAVINEALRRASGTECQVDWRRADDLISQLRMRRGTMDLQEALDWWLLMSTRFDDGEGHLVIGLLSRHGLVDDPHGLPVRERMVRARERFWNVPAWMEDALR
jgi:hypothetical protein